MKISSLALLISLACFSLGAVGYAEDSLPSAEPGSVGMNADKLRVVNKNMENLLAENRLAGGVVVVARRGKVVHFEAYGKRNLATGEPMEKDTIFRIYSMTKAITSAAALMLEEEEKLDLDDPLSQFFPPLKRMKIWKDGNLIDTEREATVRDLMRHTSGLTYGWKSSKPIREALRSAGVLDRNKKLVSMINGMDKVPLQFQPGSDWVYGCSTDVLGGVVEVASGMPFDEFLEERIFKPLKMKDTGFYIPANKVKRFAANYNYRKGMLTMIDNPKTSRFLVNPAFKSGGGGLCSTASDYMRFLLMIANGGKFEGKRYLTKKSIKLMTTNQVPKEAGWVTIGKQVREGIGYGLGFSVREKMSKWDPDRRLGEYGWGGAASTHYWVSPKDELVVLTLEQVMPYSFSTEWALKKPIYDALLE